MPATTQTPDTAAAPAVADSSAAHTADSSPGAVDLFAVAGELSQSMPEVQEHAVAQARAQAAAQAGMVSALPADKAGTRFDPALHATNDDGSPKLTATGAYAKKRGRKAGGPALSTMPASGPKPGIPGASAEALATAAQAQAARSAGIQAAQLVFAVGVIFGGDEWQPRTDAKTGLDERAMMEGAMGEYFVSQGKTDIPPGIALTFCMLAYAAPRFAMPKTQSRVQTVKAKIVQWWTNRKLRKMGMQANIEASRVGEKK